ncbi:MAG: hypothetical protein MUP16_04045, partial [Sedimentisphaerales bacterium]|nr:hypothetical protein [Sedimentisphaerales bacterium]
DTLHPDGTGDREATFQLINGIILKGGYAGAGESDPNARDVDMYKTTLSGDLNSDDVDVNDPYDLRDEPTRSDNSYHVVTGSGTDKTAILDGFTITAGNADGTWWDKNNSGAGMYNEYGSPTAINCIFTSNGARYDPYTDSPGAGGGMYNYCSSPTVANCTFSSNFASGYGGGMYNDGTSSEPHVTNCIFANNWGYLGGGMDNCYSSPMLTGCTFVGNRAGYGGAISSYYSASSVIGNCWFIGNSASCEGGGMYNERSTPKLTNCTFLENLAEAPLDSGGGGMFNSWGSSPVLTNCSFKANSASRGGGIFNERTSLTLVKCIFSGNRALWGGGMYNYDESNLMVTNCTFSRNSAATGNALACDSLFKNDPSKVGAANCILWDGGDEIWNNDGSIINIAYTDVKGGWPGEGNLNKDPCFADPNNGDYHLKSQAGRWDANSASWVKDDVTSPCIDAGDPASPIGLEPFPNGGIINMGAYGGTAEASKSYFGQPLCETIVAGDINGDCKVDFKDFALMAFHWLEEHQ